MKSLCSLLEVVNDYIFFSRIDNENERIVRKLLRLLVQGKWQYVKGLQGKRRDLTGKMYTIGRRRFHRRKQGNYTNYIQRRIK